MSTFDSLSHARQLEAAGVPRAQAEVHAQFLQSIYDKKHKQYATKADVVKHKPDEAKTDRLIEKLTQIELKISGELSDLNSSMIVFKNEVICFRNEMSDFRSSYKYILLINGVMAIVCLSTPGLVQLLAR